jgi:hypothetical protein
MRKRKLESKSSDTVDKAGSAMAAPATRLAALRGYPFVVGLISMAVLTTAASMMGSLELVWGGVFLTAAVVFLAIVGYAASPYGGAGSIVGIFVLALPLFVAPAVIDVPLLGIIVEGQIPQASGSRWAAGYRLTEAALRTELKASQVIVTPRKPRGGGSWPVTYTVVPVVPADWTPSEPVRFWLVAQSGTSAPADWTATSTSGVRLGQDDDRDRAIIAIAEKAGLVSADTRILIRWTPNPDQELKSAWLSLAVIIGVAAIAWTATVAVFRVRG